MDHEVSNSSSSEPNARVLPFRRRGSLFAMNRPQPSPVQDLEQFERAGGEDDYRHRMIMNGAALLATATLIGAGIWIADTMAQMRKNQDCVLSGKKNCTPIKVPVAPPAPK
jgi:hypothetical protein